MKTLKLASIIVLTMLVFTTCKNDDELVEQPKEIDGLETIDVKVILPEGSDFDLTTTKIISLSRPFDVTSTGESKIAINPESPTLIYLQDENENMIFMGFITDQDRELSIKSTGQASLYFALGTIFQFQEIKQKYLDEYHTNPEIVGFHEKLTNLFLADSNFLEKDVFQNLIAETVKDLIDPKQVIDIASKGIIVEDTKEKSGIRVTNEGPLSIGFQSQTRRRTHAFIYKTASKKEGDKAFTVELSDISGSVECTKEVPIETTDGFTSLIGTFWSAASGKGQDLFIKDTPPVSLPLTEDEIAAKYEVRVIGLNCDTSEKSKMTLKEREKFEELQLDFFVFDLVLPTLGTIFGAVEFDGVAAIIIKEAVVGALGSETLELINNGKYKEAVINFLGGFTQALVNDLGLEAGLKKVVVEILKSAGLDSELDLDDIKQLKKLIRPFAVADALLQLNDSFGRILGDACNSNAIESWEVIATKSNVTLSPRNDIIKVDGSKLFEVLVEEDDLANGQSFEFEWTTTGDFGKFTRNGSSGNTYSGTEKTLEYTATITEEELSSLNEAIDSVSVKVYIKEGSNRSLIGEDKTSIKIVEDSYKIIPNGVTVNGGIEVALSVVDFKNNPIVAPSGKRLIILWSTSGKYGKFAGTSNSYSSGDGQILYNKAPYNCLDFETEQGVENISAKIYFENDDGVSLIDELETTINIDNNENKIVFIVNAKSWIWSTTVVPNVGTSVSLTAGFVVPYYEDATSYQIEILDWKLGGIVRAGQNQEGDIYTWTNESQSYPIGPVEEGDDISRGYGVHLAGAGLYSGNSGYDQTKALYDATTGEALVTVTLPK